MKLLKRLYEVDVLRIENDVDEEEVFDSLDGSNGRYLYSMASLLER